MAICNDSLQSTVVHRFDYYDHKGQLLAQTRGAQPEASWYDQAYYVVSDQAQLLKNLDSRSTIQKDIDGFRQELIATPISNITSIIEINDAIRALSNYLDRTEQISAA
jgi:hypothetical protein